MNHKKEIENVYGKMIKKIINILKSILDFLYYKDEDEEVMLTVRITTVLCGLLSVLMAWCVKIHLLLSIIVVILFINLIIAVITTLQSIWR